jgi:hypothetical protein
MSSTSRSRRRVVVLPDGREVAKETTRDVTYAVAVCGPTGHWFVARWSGSERTAARGLANLWPSCEKAILPVVLT